MRNLAIIMSFLALSAPGALAGDSPRTISVSGSASVEAAPDMATITLGVTRQAQTAGEALAAVREISAAIFARLEGAGIAPRDMQTSNLDLRPLYSDRSSAANQPPGIVGYQASNMVTVRVLQLDDLGNILDQVARDGANTFNGLQFGIVDADPLADQARAAAVRDAMARAALLAQAAGVTLGPVLSISDQSGAAPMPVADMAFARAAESMPVAGGELSIRASVSMVFAIGE